jgi:ABC-2 type transport system permease protein
MSRIIASEWRKVRAIPTMWWLLAATAVVGAGGTVLGFTVSELNDLPLNTGDGLATGLHVVGLSTTLALVAGIIGMAGEFRFGQADQTFLSTPRRSRVVLAKLAVLGLMGAVIGTVAAAVSLATAWIWLTAKGVGLPFGQALLWQTLGGTAASAALFAVLGVAVGAALRNQVVAIVLVLAVQVVVENSIFSASATVGRWLPFRAGDALRQFPAEGLLTAQSAALALAAWIAVVLVAGLARTLRSDVT